MICKALDPSERPALYALLAQYPQLNWTSAMLEDSLNAPHNQAFGLFDQGALVSFVLFQVVCNEAEILLIATDVQKTKKGYATQLLQAVGQGYGSICLEVRASNHAARQFYEKCGFVCQGLRQHYYAYPDEDAILYRK